MSIDINAIGLFHCKSESATETIQIMVDDEVDEYEVVSEVTRELLGRLTAKDFVDSKSARVHGFTEEAGKPRDVSATSTRELLKSIVNRNDLKDDFRTLASWYHQTDYAQSGLLILTHHQSNGHPQLAIIKAPFLDDTYEPDDEDVLTRMDSVIKGELKKGILYPRITPDGREKLDQCCLYQGQTSGDYAKHWYQYLHLEPSKTPKEVLDEEITDKDNNSPLSEAKSTEDFDDISEEITGDLRDAKVKIEIGNKEVRVSVSELLEKRGVNLTETDGGYQLILSGDKPTIKYYSNQKGEERELLAGLENYDDVDTVLR